jgi:hypothetical protein
MHYPLLTSLFGEVYLVNCEVKDNLVTVGAMYIAPLLKQNLLRFKSPDKAVVDIQLPDEFLNNSGEGKAYGVTLETVSHTPAPHDAPRTESDRNQSTHI